MCNSSINFTYCLITSRAGEAGRGFAVVADEVRKLAERTQHATGKIESIIGSLQQKSNLASVEMTKSVESVQAGVDNIGETNEGFKSAVESVMDLHREMKTVAESVSCNYCKPPACFTCTSCFNCCI